jgi:hypothetical protein
MAIGLTFLMLALLIGCYGLSTLLVWFAEDVIRPRTSEPVDPGDLPPTDILQQTGLQ